MRRILFFSFFLSLGFLPIFKTGAQVPEQIENYSVDIVILESGEINITEEITYNFGNGQRHGLDREIPLIKENSRGERFKISIDNISVKTAQNQEVPYKITRNDYLKIRIGDPDRKITGVHTYTIFYTVSGALTYFEDFDELYWNVTGTEWDVPIQNVSAVVTLPEEIPSDKIELICYTGKMGSTSKECTKDLVALNKAHFKTKRALGSFEGLTVVVNFPTGYVEKLLPQRDRPGLLTILGLILGGLVLLIMNLILPAKKIIELVKQKKKLKKEQRIVAAWFTPPEKKDGSEFSPAETRAILEGKADVRSVTSEIIFLAQKGYLKIIAEGNKKFKFKQLKETDDSLTDFQKLLLEALFHDLGSTSLSEGLTAAKDIIQKTIKGAKEAKETGKKLTNEDMEEIQAGVLEDMAEKKEEITLKELKKSEYFGTKFPQITKKMVGHLDEEGIYKEDLNKLRTKNVLIGFGSAMVLGLINTIVYVIAAIIEKPRTEYGIEAYSKAKSLKNFLESQEKQLEFQADKIMLFEKLLPYATAFGVEDVWIKRFKDIIPQSTDWYQGNITPAQFAAFSSSVNSSVRNSVSNASRSSSGFSSGSSGGFSGGGGGGGGGGSW